MKATLKRVVAGVASGGLLASVLVTSTLVWGVTLASAELSDEVNVTYSSEDSAAEFGSAVAVSADGSTMVGGAERDDVDGTNWQGSATVFTWSGSA